MCPIPHPPNTPSQAAACLCPLRTSLTLVPLSVSLLLTVHVTVSAVTDQGLKGNLGEKVSAGCRPACAKLRLSHCGWLCWCGWGGGRPESIAQSTQVSWFISGRLQALFWKALGVTFGRRFPQCLDYLCLFLERSEVLRLPTLDKEMFGMEQLTKSYHFGTRPKLSKCYVVTRSLFESVFGMTEHSKLNLVHWASVPVVANVVWAILKPVPFGSSTQCLYKPAVLRRPFIELEWYVFFEAEQAMWWETNSSFHHHRKVVKLLDSYPHLPAKQCGSKELGREINSDVTTRPTSREADNIRPWKDPPDSRPE